MRNTKGSDIMSSNENAKFEIATFAGGCFWCMIPPFDGIDGVIETKSGYTGGKTPNPTYKEVSTGKTAHLEAIQIIFDPTRVSYTALLDIFWQNIDPTDAGGQFYDRGSQYRIAIFYHNEEQKKLAEKSKLGLEKSGHFDKPIAAVILEAGEFYPAEEYHQNYHKKNPEHYKQYKTGSGREAFLQKSWSRAKVEAEALSGEKKTKESYKAAILDNADLKKRLTPLQ